MNAFAPVLVAVESLTLRMHAAEVLAAAGIQALLAANREEALATLSASGSPSAMVIGEDGFGHEVLNLVRKVNPLTPCVVLGSRDSPVLRELNEEMLEEGVDFLAPGDIRASLAQRIRELSEEAGSSRRSKRRWRVLLVDDSPTFLHRMSESLESQGYEVSLVRSGEEALEWLEKASSPQELPDAILLDMLMPGISGNETSRRIKRHPLWRAIPIIVLTGRDEQQAIAEALNAGADDFVAKSSDDTVLRARLRAQLRRKASEDESLLIREKLLESELEVAKAQADRELARIRARLLTDLEAKNEELSQEKERAESILESITDAFLAVDSQWRLEYLNGEARRLLGQEDQPALGRILWEVLPQLARGQFQRELISAMKGRKEVEFEVEVAALGAWFEVRVFPAAEGLSVYFRDVTARRRITENRMLLLEASKRLGRSLDFERTLDLVGSLLLGQFCDVCLVFIDGPEYGKRKLLRLLDPELQSWADRELARLPPINARDGAIGEAMKESRTQLLQIEDGEERRPLGRKFNEVLNLSSFLAVPLAASGNTFGALMVASSQRIYNNEDLALAQEFAGRAALALENARLYRESQEAVRLRDEFLAVASHELRTPLTTLRLLIQGQIRRHSRRNVETIPAEAVRSQLERADAQSARLSRLVDTLLDITRLSTDGLDLALQQVDLAALTREVADRHLEKLKRAGSHLSLIADKPILGWWDPDRLDQVVSNLLSNAIKYGSGSNIEIKVNEDSQSAFLEVSDEGIGIAPEAQKHIFERFARGVSEQHYGGLGLGLWIARQIVEAHHGTIQVKSELDVGSTFTVKLPKEPPHRENEKQGEKGEKNGLAE